MAMLQIDGVGNVEVDNSFLSLPPDRQAAEVEAIAGQIGGGQAAVPAAQAATASPNFADMSAGDVAISAVRNIPSSAVQFAKDVAQPVLHPIDTAIAIKNIGAGVLQKVGILSGDDQEKYADAVGKFFVDRYGSSEGIKKAIATDPVGVLSDVATVLTAGGALAAKAPGMAGKAGSLVKTVGQTIDPLNAAGVAAKAVGKGAAAVIGGIGTNTGGQAIVEAAKAGAEGGEAAKVFRENMRGVANIEDVVTDAKSALQQLRLDRGAEYRASMAKVAGDTTALDFTKIDDAIKTTQNVKTFKGQDLSPSTKAVRADIASAIDGWKKLDPADFHTAEGIDALKQKIGDIRDAQKYGTPERLVADKAYNAIRQTIVDQVPEYAKVMSGYESATKLIQDIEKTLSLNPKASVDTAVRKLQSVLRNNVNTNYGRREVLADYLVSAGATHLVTALAGQALNAATPRGIGKVTAGLVAAGGGAGLLSGVGTLPGLVALGLLPLTSPRAVGEAAFAAGRASNVAPTIGRSAFQTGRATTASEGKRK